MRSAGQDIVELFGFQPDDTSEEALRFWNTKQCPFTQRQCFKIDHGNGIVYGTCSVTGNKQKGGGYGEIIVCPNRFYAETYEIFQDVTRMLWPGKEKDLIIGGDLAQLKTKAQSVEHPIIAFGQHSGREIQVRGKNKLSLDWVFQEYTRDANRNLIPGKFVGMELQSIDITGNYRDNWNAYRMQKEGQALASVAKSGHGLNWANVHKRLVPQIIRKGNVYAKSERCAGFFFVIPEAVYCKFEDVVEGLTPVSSPAREHISVITYKLGDMQPMGSRRRIQKVREIHYRLDEFALSFIRHCPEDAPRLLDTALGNVFK